MPSGSKRVYEARKARNAGETETERRARIRKARMRDYRLLKMQFLEAVQAGCTIQQALDTFDIAPSTYYKSWRKEPAWAAQIDLAVQHRRDGEFLARSWGGDFTSFRKLYFGMDTYLHMQMIVNAIERCPKGGITMILVPPEHGKTTLMEDYISYRIAMDPDIRITVVSEGQPHARKILRRVAARMEDPLRTPGYYQRYGPFRADSRQISKPWAADFLTVAKATHDERDYTLEARGWRSAVAGTRVDLLLVDDIQSYRSVNQTDLMLSTFRQDFLTRPGREGQTVIVGTRVEIGDFYDACIAANIVDELIELPAIDPDGHPLCAEMWPLDALRRKRRLVGEGVWWRNYMQQPRQAGTQTFDAKLLADATDTRTVGEQPKGAADVVIGIDPALAGNCAFVACAYNSENLWVLDAESTPDIGSVEAICAKIEHWARRFGPSTVVIEGNAFQKGLVHDERLRGIAAACGFRVTEHTTNRNKLDEDIGVARMPTSFLDRSLWIPGGDQATRDRMAGLREELAQWRPHVSGTRLRQDQVMALWFCWLHWRRWKDVPGGYTSGVRRVGLPWAPTQNLMRAKVASR